MKRHTIWKPIKLAAAFAVALQLMVLPMAPSVFAQQRDQRRHEQREQHRDGKRDYQKEQRRDQKRGYHGRYDRGRKLHRRPGHVIRRLPPRHHRVFVHKKPYYYHGGFFFRPGSGGYIRVRAPLGAIVVDLPLGAVSLRIGGIAYYHFSGVYYRHVPTGYVVVERPVEAAPPVEVEEDVIDTTVAVTAQLLNVRQGPAAGHPVVAQVHRGTHLAVVGTAPGWLYVELPGGDLGWVMEAYTRPVEEPAQG